MVSEELRRYILVSRCMQGVVNAPWMPCCSLREQMDNVAVLFTRTEKCYSPTLSLLGRHVF